MTNLVVNPQGICNIKTVKIYEKSKSSYTLKLNKYLNNLITLSLGQHILFQTFIYVYMSANNTSA